MLAWGTMKEKELLESHRLLLIEQGAGVIQG